MNRLHSITQKQPNAHLSYEHYQFIQSEYNHFQASKAKGKLALMKAIASTINTSLSNLYAIERDGTIEVLDSHLCKRKEFSADAAMAKRTSKPTSNNLKLQIAKPFIDEVVTQFHDDTNLASIDEIMKFIRIHEPQRFQDTVCTKSIYNYIHRACIPIKPIDCRRMTTRSSKKPIRVTKRQKGVSIEHRPFLSGDRSTFGHWEGDLVVGKNIKEDTPLFTLVEQKTRYQIIMRLPHKTAKSVFMAINKLEKTFGLNHSQKIFKSITFDNGSEFSRYQDIVCRPNTKIQRTSVYFAHPYASWERGSNEHANGLIRYRIPKGYLIQSFSKDYIVKTNQMINQKKRKILGYLSAQSLFYTECEKLNITIHPLS